MQTIRQTVRLVVQQRSNIPMRFAGRSTNKEKNLNQTKTGENKGKTTQIDDTKQPGVTRKDWSRPNQVTSNDPQYGKGGKPNPK